MPEKPLYISLEVRDPHSGRYILTFDSSQYPILLNLKGNIVVNEWLRRLRPVLAGQSDPAGGRDPQNLLRNMGMWLWQVLIPESAPEPERKALTQLLRVGHTPVLLALPDMLTELPWELLCDPESSGEKGFLARHRPLVRLNVLKTAATLVEPPLRVLLLISSPPTLGEDSRVDVESERAAVEQAVREMREARFLHLLVEDIVTPQRVEHHLVHFKPHIVHYVGHGDYDQTRGGYCCGKMIRAMR